MVLEKIAQKMEDAASIRSVFKIVVFNFNQLIRNNYNIKSRLLGNVVKIKKNIDYGKMCNT